MVNAYFGHGTGQIVLDDVQCTGSENKLLACRSASILSVSNNCDHSDDAGVRCEGCEDVMLLYFCTRFLYSFLTAYLHLPLVAIATHLDTAYDSPPKYFLFPQWYGVL